MIIFVCIACSAPTVTEEISVPPLEVNANIILHCPIEGAVQSQWLKVTNQGDILPFGSPSSILSVEFFSTADQGYYYCEGIGGGAYSDQIVSTEPVPLILEGIQLFM